MTTIDFYRVENLRYIFVSIASAFLSVFPHTANFVLALLILYGFNVFCGMCADGITIRNCKPFRMKKFRASLIELFIYVLIVKVVHNSVHLCDNESTAMYASRVITLILCYVYLRNSFRNLVVTYPMNIGYRIIYYTISLELTKIIPSQLNEIIKREEERQERIKNGEEVKL